MSDAAGISFIKTFANRTSTKHLLTPSTVGSGKSVILSTPKAPPSESLSYLGDREPPPPSLELAKARVVARLPQDPSTTGAPRLADFEPLGLGVYSYIAHLHRLRFFFMLLALLSVSSLVANGYGGQLTDKQLNAVTWAFTGASLGNAKSIAPSYGATELLISLLMTIFLFWAETALYNDAHRVEQKQVTAADYGVMVSGLPRDLTAGPIETALAAAPEVAHLHVADHGIVVPLHQRELILQQRELASNGAKREAYAADIDALTVAKQKLGSLSPEGAQRLEKLKTALTQADGARQKLLDGARDIVTGKYDAEGPRCAGVAFITFEDAHDALSLLEQGSISLPSIGSSPFPVERPPEPSDVIWENLGCTDGVARQLRGTFYMFCLSLMGAFLIGASAYLQPKGMASNGEAAGITDISGMTADLGVIIVGTLVLLCGYLVVFITVPIVEVEFMRHTSVTQKEVSQVLKLVVFQVMATLSTIGSFAADTAGAFNRDWYITGGFMLVNGMFVDLFVITCVIQGWGLMLNVGRLVLAPQALTQFEMDQHYAGDGANMYVADRMQLVTKFVVMCYICSAAIPLLHFVVLFVLTMSIGIDEHNLLRRLHPSPQSDESVVKVILVFVMPFAVLAHLFAAHIFFADLRAPTAVDLAQKPPPTFGHGLFDLGAWSDWLHASWEDPSWSTFGFGSAADDGLDLVVWSLRINLVLVVIFILREWPHFGRKLSSSGAEQTPSSPRGKARAILTRAVAGSAWNALEARTPPQNEALSLSHNELEAKYRREGREAELRYACPDTSKLREQCRAVPGGSPLV